MSKPTSLIIPAVTKHTATVIMAHGLGDSGAGWVSLAENWRRRQKFEEVKFIFPNAPAIPITVNMGMTMPGWYDITQFGDLQASQDERGILRSRDYFHSLIASEVQAGIPSERIVIGGFSQGGAMSIFSGITAPTKLGGIFGLSCYLLLHNKIKGFVPVENPNKETPILMGHGDSDPLVKPEWGQMTAKILGEWGWNVELKMYRGLEHSADPEEIDDVERFLNARIPAVGDKPVVTVVAGWYMPNIMYEKDHPVYPELQKIGREITQQVKPKAIVVFSAHWQGERSAVEVNGFENTELIYDFYGFPSHYYKETFPNKGSPSIAEHIIELLTAHNIPATSLRRGLDHGVWASFKVAFSPTSNPLLIPIIQVSLVASESPTQHLALGRAVTSLRAEGICIVVSGMAVHNLHDVRYGFAGQPRPYAESFDEALREAVETDVSHEGGVQERERKMVALLERGDARSAHPTFEHLLPVHIGVGAAGGDQGKRLFSLVEGCFSWAQFRWGEP
ncbi:hypothetical protein JHW43_004270 [Diplocarpon mali]|nr:hypothetical protein JHW43_004270 [Diplocarpon mali]